MGIFFLSCCRVLFSSFPDGKGIAVGFSKPFLLDVEIECDYVRAIYVQTTVSAVKAFYRPIKYYSPPPVNVKT